MDSRQGNVCIGVVIVNYNSAFYLKKALSALAVQTVLPFEVIILDNNSDEILPDLSCSPLKIKVIRSPLNLGFAAGNNLAIKHLDSQVNWIALLNPDAYPKPNWLEEMQNGMNTYPDYTFFGCTLICDNQPTLLDGTGDAYHLSGRAWRMHHQQSLEKAPQETQEIFSPCAAAALYSRTIFNEVNGFDEKFFCYYEDIDLAFRLRLLGYKCCYLPKAIVHHTGSATTKRHSSFYTYYGHRNLVWTYVKNMPLALLIISLPLHCLINIATIFAMIKHKQVKTVLKAKLHSLTQLRPILKERKRVQETRVITCRQLLAILNKGMPW